MKTKPRIVTLCVATSLACVWLASAGDLNPPPGPVAPTMKTLTEIEPRIAIDAANTPGTATCLFRIAQPGSYYLTGNIAGVAAKSGIIIGADNVTIDLAGFSLQGVAGSLDGIATDALHKNLTILNGSVSGWGQDGIDLTQGSTSTACLVEGVHASGNTRGIVAGFASVVRRCTSTGNSSHGFSVSGSGTALEGCVSYLNTGTGYSLSGSCTAIDCAAEQNTGGGFRLLGGCAIHGCTAGTNGTAGIFTQNAGSVIDGCACSFNNAPGISIGSGACIVRGCQCYANNASPGIILNSGAVNCRIEGNNCTTNGTGIRILSAGNIVVRNTCSDNSTNNWDIAIGNAVAPIVQSATNAAAITGNTYAGALGSTDPNANFTY